jgi:hypothetical protein
VRDFESGPDALAALAAPGGVRPDAVLTDIDVGRGSTFSVVLKAA